MTRWLALGGLARRVRVGVRCGIVAGVLVAGACVQGASGLGAALAQPEAWLRSVEGRRVLEHVLSWQTPAGDWPKNTDTAAAAYLGKPSELRGTFDNGATTGELRFLARVVRFTGEGRAEEAFRRGLDHLLGAQYPHGGWPQSAPPGAGYARHITFNDDAMVRLLKFVREVGVGEDYGFVDAARRARARAAFARGIACIVRCQVRVDGRLTAWCAQHDEIDFRPRGARTYELPSLSGAESAGILELLMSLEQPGPEAIRAVHAGAAWFEAVKLTGLRQTRIDGNKVMRSDPAAPPLWARFYEIETNRPFFCGRDGVKKYALSEIEGERRNGYAWYGEWGARVAQAYAAWQRRWPLAEPVTSARPAASSR